MSESLAEGGIDNITVIVADVVEAGGTEDAVVLGAAEERTIPPPQTPDAGAAPTDDVEDTLITERPLVTVDDEARYTPLAPNKRRFIRPLVVLFVCC